MSWDAFGHAWMFDRRRRLCRSGSVRRSREPAINAYKSRRSVSPYNLIVLFHFQHSHPLRIRIPLIQDRSFIRLDRLGAEQPSHLRGDIL